MQRGATGTGLLAAQLGAMLLSKSAQTAPLAASRICPALPLLPS